MKKYILKRLLLIPVTLFGIMLINFMFIQLAPGGPVEQMMMKMDQLPLVVEHTQEKLVTQ